MQQINIAIAIAGIVVVLLGLVSARMESLPLSKPLMALLVGIAVGPEVLGWLVPEHWSGSEVVLKEAARFTLAISVFGITLRTPRRDYKRLLRPVAMLVVIGMVVMWGVSAGLAWTLLGVSPLLALLVGAVLTPTDPVVASSIVTGARAERMLPNRLR
ncbi:MAG: cation:proton antiporter, partial [Sphingomonadales bacterium]